MVYKKPNFDAPIIGYFKRGRKVRISTRLWGAFYKVRFKQGVVGFISDVDVQTNTAGSQPKKAKSKSPDYVNNRSFKKPFIDRFYVGLSMAWVDYQEVIGQQQYSSSMTPFGVKVSFPFPLMEGPFFSDLTVLYQSQAPEHYSQFTTGELSGKFILSDISIMYYIDHFANKKGKVYIGGGPSVALSNFYATNSSGAAFDISNVSVGAVFGLGVAYEIGDFIFKVEPRYYVEKSSYLAVPVSIQYGF